MHLIMKTAPTLVATSINPFNRLPEQLRAFHQWKSLGADIVTFNVADEAERLNQTGLPSEAIIVIPEEDTALKQGGKAIPRITPILARLQKEARKRTAVLVNSDIYPATRTCRVFEHLLDFAPALALTREETPVLEDHSILSLAPYRGGIDAFVFKRPALLKVNAALRNIPVSETMCFGVPGWDFLLSAVIESDPVGGAVMDSGFLLHASHATIYNNLDDFKPFSSTVAKLANLKGETHMKIAEGYARRIEASCQKWADRTNMLRAIHFAQVPLQPEVHEEARRLTLLLSTRLPYVAACYRHTSLVALIDRHRSQGRPDFFAFYSFFVRSQENGKRFCEVLAAIACGVICMPLSDDPRPFPDDYEPSEARASIKRIAKRNLSQRRLEFAYLFGTEVIEYGVFDTDLLDEIDRCCKNAREQEAVSFIRELWSRLGAAA
ncbi:MAG: hypothetical protein AB8B85_03755 [Paracoccaceae bacterium]